MAVRALEPRDVDAVLAIQAASPEIAQWSRADYERVEAGEMAGWVAERISDEGARAPVVVGFLVARNIPPEVEILNLAVVPSARQHGVGSALFDAAIAWARSVGATQCMLEVRAANDVALRLYHRRNFQVVGRRPRYYANPVDDALLLTVSLK
ncbi:MAG: GNAT family N-acetyltransferase [Candidatus Acidiferrales bacterium]